MSDEVIQSLKQYGFTEYEAKAYAALVDLGRGTAREICEISGVPHGRIYTVLKALSDSGFVEVHEGVPTIFQPQDIAEVFGGIKNDYCSSIDRLIDQLTKIQIETKPSSNVWSAHSFWSIHSERGIQIRLKTIIRNAKEDIILLSKNSHPIIGSLVDDLKTAKKQVNLTIIAYDTDSFSGLRLKAHPIGEELSGMFEEMAQKSAQMKDPLWNTEIFIIADGMTSIAVGQRLGKRSATVIEMPLVCFMLKRLIELHEPAVRR
jgi:sugar-specific transcriptional regulator TrmB